ncbi:Translation initiation factor 1A / IF-1 family protein [Theileria parva strain Muguga]|uniref:Translation initiation factor 1A / IF-1 family protein n=1 Tax=Theileria parva strain Muguga TaxID=333668 RepID=UPI001C61E17B|nr:Translation initiation factor 1A / IF-1 family protein [Theileria parva strain Muguga]EAN33835.2 Translation initiation factor 1A / IF-1 family protein [Theileria parva strain Muguga]
MNLTFILIFWNSVTLVFLKESLCFNNFRRSNFTHYFGRLSYKCSPYSKRFNLNSSPKPTTSDGTKIIRSGVVVSCMPNANFLVKLDVSNRELPCSLAGKLYINMVRIWNNSKVNVEIDLERPTTGRIIERLSDK